MGGEAESRIPMVEDHSDAPRVQIITKPKSSSALYGMKKWCLNNCGWIITIALIVSVATWVDVMHCWRGCHPIDSTPSCNISGKASPVAEAITGEKVDVGRRRGKRTGLQSLGCEPILKKFSVRDIVSKFPRDDLQDLEKIWPEYVTATRCLDEFSYCGAQGGPCGAAEAGVRRREISVIFQEGSAIKQRKFSIEEHTMCTCRAP